MKKLDIKGICHRLIDKKYKRIILMFIAILLLNSLIAITTGTNYIEKSVNQLFSTLNNYTEEKKNITPLKSDGYDSEVGGSIKIEKSAEWTGYKKAKINISLDTIDALTDGGSGKATGIDAIFVVDTSGSMYGSKLTQAKQDIITLSNELLDDSNNKVALISFNTTATIKSNFTNDKNVFTSSVNSLTYSGSTDYGKAYKEVGNLLSSYTIDDNRDIIMVFLTDGFPTSKGHKTEYTYLKQKYPDMLINGIQYELGRSIIQDVIDMSDYQYLSNRTNLYDTLFNIYGNLSNHKYQKYESFILEDILSDDFEVDLVDNIKVSTGTIVIDNKKVKWNLGENEFKSGNKATMEINVFYKGEVKKDFFPTNDALKVTYKLANNTEQKLITEETPVLQNGYEVIYETNAPKDCHNILLVPSKEIHFFDEKVTKSIKELECDSYIFQGWELTDDTSTDINKNNEETFIMPSHDVVYRGIWSTLNIEKNMEGEVAKELPKVPFDTSEAQPDTGIRFYEHSDYGIDNGYSGLYMYIGMENDKHPIYYYRGAVTNNNVLFANFCWKIVRTTETGGIKLIYNGISTSDNKCTNTTGDVTQIGVSTFNSGIYSRNSIGYTFTSGTEQKEKDSKIKIAIDSWYKTNIDDKGYTKYLEDAVWCNDRTTENASASTTYYGAVTRLDKNKERPKVKDEEVCPNKGDRYTVTDTTKGNGALTYPVGLITADEAELGGMGWYDHSGNTYNKTSYLYTGKSFWLLSPGWYNNYGARVFQISSSGDVYDSYTVDHSLGVRPSVSLRFGTTFSSGDGEMNTPYIVEGQLDF